MPFTFTFFKSLAGHCTLPPSAAIMSAGRSIDEDVGDQGDEKEHVDEASLKPGTVWLIVLSER